MPTKKKYSTWGEFCGVEETPLKTEPMITKVEVNEIQDIKDKSTLILNNNICIIKCYATWCSACTAISPSYDELAKKYSGKAVFCSENVESNISTGIEAIPTFLVYKNGKLAEKIVGADLKKVESHLI
jgi:thioredoxin 1